MEFTTSRPRYSNDKGRAETKNGASVRKHFGHSPIPQHWAGKVNAFCEDFLNPYVNDHRHRNVIPLTPQFLKHAFQLIEACVIDGQLAATAAQGLYSHRRPEDFRQFLLERLKVAVLSLLFA